MTHEFIIFVPGTTRVSMHLILEELDGLGFSCEWTSTFLSDRADLDSWSAGRIVRDGANTSGVSLFAEEFETWFRDELLESYGSEISSADRQALNAAATSYRIKTGDVAHARVAAHLVGILAGPDSVILDLVADQFVSFDGWQQKLGR